MAYSDFTIPKVRATFDLILEETVNLFAQSEIIAPSDYLKMTLQETVPLATTINTEKVRSELIIAPVLLEVRRLFPDRIGFFSGVEFNVDSSRGLIGFCDYLLTASREELEIRAPIMTVVEAKNENLKGGLGQCIATMVGVQHFNQLQNQAIDPIYGCVTSGTNWKFLKLEATTVAIDQREYFINEIELILGILALPFKTYFVPTATL